MWRHYCVMLYGDIFVRLDTCLVIILDGSPHSSRWQRALEEAGVGMECWTELHFSELYCYFFLCKNSAKFGLVVNLQNAAESALSNANFKFSASMRHCGFVLECARTYSRSVHPCASKHNLLLRRSADSRPSKMTSYEVMQTALNVVIPCPCTHMLFNRAYICTGFQ